MAGVAALLKELEQCGGEAALSVRGVPIIMSRSNTLAATRTPPSKQIAVAARSSAAARRTSTPRCGGEVVRAAAPPGPPWDRSKDRDVGSRSETCNSRARLSKDGVRDTAARRYHGPLRTCPCPPAASGGRTPNRKF